MLQFIESIKVEDQKVFLLNRHQQRMTETFLHFGKVCEINLQELFKELQHDENGLYKWRIVYDLNNVYKAQMLPYAISKLDDFELVTNDDLDYSFKYLDRKMLDSIKSKSNASEIIIVKNNSITDTSFSNILFLKNKQWYTPSSYLLNGVQRQQLLESKKIKTADITLDNIKEYSHFQLINAMNNFDDMFIYPIEKIINLPKPEVSEHF
ncbi:aminotransferase class IV [Chryseobacterium sp. T1]